MKVRYRGKSFIKKLKANRKVDLTFYTFTLFTVYLNYIYEIQKRTNKPNYGELK